MTTTPDDFTKSGTRSFETGSNWSTGTVPNLDNGAEIALPSSTTVNMTANDLVNSIGIGDGNTLNINGVALSVVNGTGTNAIAAGGFINTNNGGTLNFKGAGVDNLGAISLNATSSATMLEISGSTTISGASGSYGAIELGGASGTGDLTDDEIVSDGKDNVTLKLVNQILKGAGTVGDSHLTLDNGGVILAEIPDETLQLNTGDNTIDNEGILEAGTLLDGTSGGGILAIDSPVENNGTILSVGAGSIVELGRAVTGSGTIDIGADSVLWVEAPVSENIAFIGSNAGLLVFPGVPINGIVTGAEAGDAFAFYVSPVGVNAVWDQTSSTSGTLSLYGGGAALFTLNVAGQFTTLNFSLTSAGPFGTEVIVQNTPVFAENSGNNDEWIMADGQWGASAGPGSHPSGYDVAVTGDWGGSGTDGILWFNPSTGDLDEWQLSNTQWSASVDLGAHPANTDGNSYQVVGTDDATDFTTDSLGYGVADVLWTSQNNDGSIATDIWVLGSDGKWTASISPGPHPAGYSVAGTGDWTGDGTDGILWFNSATGDTDEWQLSGGQWAASVDLGSHPGSGWTIAGVGDFFANGRDDVLWTNSSGGGVQTDIWELGANGQWINSVSPGDHPAGYQVAAVGDFTGTGTSDILWYDASNGDADEWLINNGQWAGSVDLGTHPGNFQIAGVGDFNGDGTKSILWHSPS